MLHAGEEGAGVQLTWAAEVREGRRQGWGWTESQPLGEGVGSWGLAGRGSPAAKAPGRSRPLQEPRGQRQSWGGRTATGPTLQGPVGGSKGAKAEFGLEGGGEHRFAVRARGTRRSMGGSQEAASAPSLKAEEERGGHGGRRGGRPVGSSLRSLCRGPRPRRDSESHCFPHFCVLDV